MHNVSNATLPTGALAAFAAALGVLDLVRERNLITTRQAATAPTSA